ncbi:Nuclear pore complex protein Nup50 [Araneus ventricosus]|uniref:Nuclear pore complex protein Nup50 n=1 Tax=Araneus ventricosus TaxID=182803 RepID=A0A4Y2F9Y1_ARAVE|nr:Nuclear pore complex protein Nup50 [Araneus ventricosus]
MDEKDGDLSLSTAAGSGLSSLFQGDNPSGDVNQALTFTASKETRKNESVALQVAQQSSQIALSSQVAFPSQQVFVMNEREVQDELGSDDEPGSKRLRCDDQSNTEQGDSAGDTGMELLREENEKLLKEREELQSLVQEHQRKAPSPTVSFSTYQRAFLTQLPVQQQTSSADTHLPMLVTEIEFFMSEIHDGVNTGIPKLKTCEESVKSVEKKLHDIESEVFKIEASLAWKVKYELLSEKTRAMKEKYESQMGELVEEIKELRSAGSGPVSPNFFEELKTSEASVESQEKKLHDIQAELETCLTWKEKYEILYENTQTMEEKYESQISELVEERKHLRSAGSLERITKNDCKNRMDTLNVTYPVIMKETTSVSEKKPSFTSSSTTENSSGSSDSPGLTPFAKFSGFSGAASPFGCSAKTDASSFNSLFSATAKKEERPSGTTASKSQEKRLGDAQPSASDAKPLEKQTRSLEYYRQSRSINESVLKWMQLHLAKNPCCDFTPVFNDYKKHMDTLNVTYPVKMKETTSVSEKKPSFTSSSTAEVSKDSTNHSGSSNDNSNLKKEKNEDKTDYGANFKSNTTNTSTFSFGTKSWPTPTSSVSSIGCTSSAKGGNDAGSEEKKTAAPFSFGFCSKTANQSNSDKPFSFACTPVAKPVSAENEEAEYVPPKNEFVAVTEEDAFYSKRCKLFFKEGESYAEKGVGDLYLKPIDGKTQLLVRADTSFGNILLNIVLSASLPMSRTGKNDVLLVCTPDPPVDAKKADSKEAIPMLIRVETSEEADKLLETLNKHKS